MALSGNRRLGGVVKVGRCCQGREVLPGFATLSILSIRGSRLWISPRFAQGGSLTSFLLRPLRSEGSRRTGSGYKGAGHTGHRSQVTGHRSQVTGHRCDRSQAAGADDLRGMYACISANGGSLPAVAGRLIPGEGTGKPLRRVWHVWQILAFHGVGEAIRFSLPPVPLHSIFGGMPFP